MIRRYISIILPLVLVIMIIAIIWWITEPNENKEPQQVEKEIISQIEFNGIDKEKYEIYDFVKISDEEYIIVTRQLIFDENSIPMQEVNNNNYYIYKYNESTGIDKKSINIDSFYQIAGIDKNKKVIYLTVTSLIIPEGAIESPYDIVELNYEKMEVQNVIAEKTDYYACLISDNGNVWTYLIDNALYSSGYNFADEKLIAGETKKEEVSYLKYVYPCDIINNDIIYIQYDAEQVDNTGICIINKDGTELRMLKENEPTYLKCNSNTSEIYYTKKSEINKVYSLNLNTLEKKVLVEYALDENAMFTSNYISPDNKNIVVVETKYVDNVQIICMYLYEINTKNLISQYTLENSDMISHINFIDDKIFFIQSNKLYEWNYNIK